MSILAVFGAGLGHLGHQVAYRVSPIAGLVPLVIWFPFSAQASL